jgi:hypothetical protein
MTWSEFENGYWYATELKDFAEAIGIPSARKLRKDELERAIERYLKAKKIEVPTKRSLTRSGPRDVEIGLALDLPVVHYTSNRETKDFIVTEAKKLVPTLGRKSGARYRLNRWREEQLTNRVAITYRDLVEKYVELNQTTERFARIPHGRYINFVSDFMATEENATHAKAVAAWKTLKKLDVPKSYRAWIRATRAR